MYAKVFASMWDGTLYGQWEAWSVFVFLLAHADRDGSVDIHPNAIAARSGLPLEVVTKGLAVLEAPDPGSRSPELDGRRLELIDQHRTWGWQIVNYPKYRGMRDLEERRKQTREAVARHRQHVSRGKPAKAGVSPVKPQKAHTDTDADTEALQPFPSVKASALRAQPAVDEAFLRELETQYPESDVRLTFSKLENHSKTYKNQRLALRNWLKSAAANGWDRKPKRLTFGDES